MRTQAKFVCESLISYEFFNLNGFREFSETCDETDDIECDDAVDDFVEVSITPSHLLSSSPNNMLCDESLINTAEYDQTPVDQSMISDNLFGEVRVS